MADFWSDDHGCDKQAPFVCLREMPDAHESQPVGVALVCATNKRLALATRSQQVQLRQSVHLHIGAESWEGHFQLAGGSPDEVARKMEMSDKHH